MATISKYKIDLLNFTAGVALTASRLFYLGNVGTTFPVTTPYNIKLDDILSATMHVTITTDATMQSASNYLRFYAVYSPDEVNWDYLVENDANNQYHISYLNLLKDIVGTPSYPTGVDAQLSFNIDPVFLSGKFMRIAVYSNAAIKLKKCSIILSKA